MKSLWQGAIVLGVAGTVIVGNMPKSVAASFSFSNTTSASIVDKNIVSRDITIGTKGSITDLTVTISNLQHTRVGNLIGFLTHLETGTTVSLFNRIGKVGSQAGDSSNFNGTYSFNDSFSTDIWSVAATGGDSFDLPSGNYFASTSKADGSSNVASPSSLSAFKGENLAGTWRLTIEDRAGGNKGSFSGWTISGEAVPVPPQIVGTLVLAGLGASKKWRSKSQKSQAKN